MSVRTWRQARNVIPGMVILLDNGQAAEAIEVRQHFSGAGYYAPNGGYGANPETPDLVDIRVRLVDTGATATLCNCKAQERIKVVRL